MALSAPTLSALIRAKRIAKLGDAVADGPELTADCDAIAEALVEHITSAAEVNAGIHVTTSGGTGATDAIGTVS